MIGAITGDTIACIAGGIAHAFYRKIPRVVEERVMAVLDPRLGRVAREFKAEYLLAFFLA